MIGRVSRRSSFACKLARIAGVKLRCWESRCMMFEELDGSSVMMLTATRLQSYPF